MKRLTPVERQPATETDPVRRGPLIVEFAGLTGSGKTTTARTVLRILEAKGYRCCSREPLMDAWRSPRAHRLGFTAFCLWNPAVVTAVARLATGLRPLRRSHCNFALHLLFIAYYLRSMEHRSFDAIVLDQSWVQTLWSLGIRGRLPDEALVAHALRQLVGRRPHDLVLVWLEIDAAAAAGRIRQRTDGASPFDRRHPDQVKRELTDFGGALRRLARLMEDVTGQGAFTVDARMSPARSAKAIANVIENRLRERKRRGSGGISPSAPLHPLGSECRAGVPPPHPANDGGLQFSG